MHDRLAGRRRHGLRRRNRQRPPLTMDGAPDGGGRNLAPRPMEPCLAGTGGCTAYDVVLILKRGRHDVRGCRVKVKAERAPVAPKVFTSIHMHFTVSGRELVPTRSRAIALSHEKYCSASIMLAKTAEITTSHEIVQPSAQPPVRIAMPLAGYTRCAVVVMTLAAARIASRSGRGSSAAPAVAPHRHAALRRPSFATRSHVTGCRVRAGAQGVRPGAVRPGARSRPQKPRLQASPARPAASPITKAPAYQSGLSRLGGRRAPADAARSRRGGRFPHALRPPSARAKRRTAGRQRLRLVQRLGADFTDMVHPHQGAGTLAVRRSTTRPQALPARPGGPGRAAQRFQRGVGRNERSIDGGEHVQALSVKAGDEAVTHINEPGWLRGRGGPWRPFRCGPTTSATEFTPNALQQ